MSAIRDVVKENPIGTTLGVWGGILLGTFVYLYRKPIPMQLKIIQARVIAQAGLLSGVMTIGMITFLQDPEGKDVKKATAIDVHHMRMYDLPKPAAAAAAPLDAAAAAPVAAAIELK